jgi:N-glycosylase/DNA lyase
LASFNLSGIPFDPDITFESGQTFRWKRIVANNESAWIGVVSNSIVRVEGHKVESLGTSINNRAGDVDFSEDMSNYFSSRDDLQEIHASFPKDEYLQKAVNEFSGLRVLTQDPWECLISFVCSITKNIPAIKMMIELLSMKFGSRINSSCVSLYTFPEPAALAKASKSDLLACKLGFRWKFIQFIANQVSTGRLDLESMSKRAYHQARNELISELSGRTFGVGPKVADCVMLFSMHKTEAFPVDVWMLRCIQRFYVEKMNLWDLLRDKTSLTMRMYGLIHETAHQYFGKYCGYAQQYLYMKIRSDSIRNRVLA